MRFFRLSLLLLLLALLLTACGGSPAGAPASSGAPPSQTTAAAAEPTAAPAAEPSVAPTTAAAEAPTSAPTAPLQSTAAPAAGASDSITFDTPTRYTQENGVFTLDAPSGWEADDRSTPGDAQVVFRDPSGAATFLARVAEATPGATDGALTGDLESYLQKTLGASDLKLTPGVRGADGRLPVSFVYTGTREGKAAPYSGGGYVAQRGNLISFTLYTAPADQFAAARSSFEQIANSYQLAPDAKVR